MPARRRTVTAALGVLAGLLVAACSSGAATSASGGADGGDAIAAVGAENQYANVISQIGGRYVQVTAIESNPNTDPHSFEASPSIAQAVSTARLVVQNGLGYDTYMNKIEAAAANPARKVIDVQSLLRLPDSTPNPHLWYSPATMPAVAKAVAGDLSAMQPAHAAYFTAGLHRFDRSLQPWYQAITSFDVIRVHGRILVVAGRGDGLDIPMRPHADTTVADTTVADSA